MKRLAVLIAACAALALVAVPPVAAKPGKAKAKATGASVSDFLIGSNFVAGRAAKDLPGQPLKIKTGDTVVWTNLDPISHDVTFEDGTFSKYLNKQGEQTHRTFTKAGYYLYRCNQHPGMNGLVYVSDSAPF